MAIVGSSNLSISGIKEHTELNLRTNHPDDSQKLLEWFDRHWNDPSCQEFTEEIADIIGKSWAGSTYTPRDVYHKAILHEHEELLDDLPMDENSKSKELFDFQKNAVGNAIKMLENYSGVMIADVVGTGKTFIGSAILKYLKDTHRSKPLIICPPHLKEMWEEYLDDFEIYGVVVSRYKIGMDDNILSRYTNCDVVLIDESHNFRNSDTNSYKALLAFMEEKTEEAKIIMLSATPISNKIIDLKNQLQLFPREMLLQIPPLNNTSLDEYFKIPTDMRDSPEADAKIRELLKYILIRRTRTQIKEKYAKKDDRGYYLEKDGEKKYFPDRELENPKEYDTDKVYNNSFETIQNIIGELKLARYAPGNYIKDEYLDQSHPEHKKYAELLSTAKPLVGIVRTSLLKRMDSSVKAFKSSIDNYEKGHEEFKKQLNINKVPIGKDFHDEIYKKITYDRDDYDEEYEKTMKNLKSEYDIKAFNKKEWLDDIIDDTIQFTKIKSHLHEENEFTKQDDKLHTLEKLIKEIGSEKILIFSESSVTTRYIHDYIKDKIPERKIKHIDSLQGQKEKNNAIKRFDPKNNRADIPKNEELDILISTDVLSEGVNLQSCGIVINYDFHWNPVRLIQRVGRIDRIGTEHDKIRIINFLPTTKIDARLALKDKVANKISTIKKIIGHDQQILDSAENFDSSAISDIYNKNEFILDADIGLLNIGETKSEQDAGEIKKDETKLEKIKKLPYGMRSVSGTGKLLIACEAQEIITNQKDEKISERTFRRHYEIIPDEKPTPIWLSSFLKQLGDNNRDVAQDSDSEYNEFVAKGWNKFNRDMKNSSANDKMLKHQTYFDKKLRKISENPDMKNRVMHLLPFINQKMLANHQPYKEITQLRKQIDKNLDFDDNKIVAEMEKIRQKYKELEYNKKISKPRILYSMMVDI